MNIILGFGSTEERFEQEEFDFCEKFITEKSNNFTDNSNFIFTDEIVDELKIALGERKRELDVLREKYRESPEYPDRYSTYYFNIVNDIHDLCVVFKFSHINRRHAMSPDGWALLGTKKVCHLNAWDFRD